MKARSKAKAGNSLAESKAAKYLVREIGSRVSLFEGNGLREAVRKRDKMRDAGKMMATIFELRGGVRTEVSPEDPTEALTRKLQLQIRQIDATMKKSNAMCRVFSGGQGRAMTKRPKRKMHLWRLKHRTHPASASLK